MSSKIDRPPIRAELVEPSQALALTSPGQIARLIAERPEPVDVEALHRLLDLQLRYDAEAARRAYVEAMSRFKASED